MEDRDFKSLVEATFFYREHLPSSKESDNISMNSLKFFNPCGGLYDK